ncbi:uncharacterized protein LOC143834130 [Paroedura picta]|uniref:uncharacterized protein LOC143834130 n=1 Tax=Paroedura picta TaxID=143630 RepID=UPI004057970E
MPRGSEENAGGDTEDECFRKSEELLRETDSERKIITQEWQELRTFIEEQEGCALRRLEELEKAVLARRDESPWGSRKKISPPGLNAEGHGKPSSKSIRRIRSK